MRSTGRHGRRPLIWACGCLATALLRPASGRNVLESTPTPCKDKYDEAEIAGWVEQHLQGFSTSKEPQMLLMLGGSGAGKGKFMEYWRTYENENPQGRHHWIKLSDFVVHGLDEYLQYIPQYKHTLADPDNVFKDAADNCYKGAAIPAARLANQQIIDRKLNLIYEETGKDLIRIQRRVLPPFHQAGYRITAIFIDNEPDIAIKRSEGRFQETGRYASDDYIRETFENTFENYEELKQMKEIKEAVYCDNHKSHIFCWSDEKQPTDAIVPRHLLGKGKPEYRWDIPKSEL